MASAIAGVCAMTFEAERTTLQEAMQCALAAVSAREYAQAEHAGRGILSRFPDHDGALSVVGLALFEQRKYEEALACFERLSRSAPHVATHWQNLGATLRALQRYDDAARCYARAAICGAEGARFFYDSALLEIDRHQPASALNLLRHAHRLAPKHAEPSVWLAESCVRAARYAEARKALAHWRSYEHLNDELLARVAALLQLLGESREEQHARWQLEQMDIGASASLVAARVYERGNCLEKAERALKRAEDLADPSLHREIASARARLAARRGDHAAACASWQEQLSLAPLRHEDLFAYAKSLDALGRYHEAFATMQAAHDAQIRDLNEWVPEALRSADIAKITERGSDRADIAEWSDPSAPDEHDSPIFIVGFPRSGTTLLEQALDAHPSLQSMDEQPFVQMVIDSWQVQGIGYPHALRHLSQAQLRDARDRYWTLVRSRISLVRGERLIDKNPLNLLRLPAIRRLFPHARIVLAIRHPLDVILSCFAQPFASHEFALLCKDPLTLARGYRLAFDAFYREAALLRPNVYELSYERLAASFEPQMRELCARVQVEWHPNVLDPAANARRKPYISTPSYAGVVQPVSTRSIGRWQAYRAHFAPALPIVAPYMARWGYCRGPNV